MTGMLLFACTKLYHFYTGPKPIRPHILPIAQTVHGVLDSYRSGFSAKTQYVKIKLAFNL